jgi:hypothetical protein
MRGNELVFILTLLLTYCLFSDTIGTSDKHEILLTNFTGFYIYG